MAMPTFIDRIATASNPATAMLDRRNDRSADLAADDLGIPHITLRQLVYFAAAARHSSALRAAETLNISPPAVSGAIAALESLLGEQLFVRRHARGLLLTEAGEELLLQARDVVGRVRDIEMTRLNRIGKAKNQVSLGCLGDIAPGILPPLLRLFKTEHPDVDVRWHSDTHPQLMSRLEDGSLDLIFVLDFELSPSLQATVLQQSPMRYVLPTNHALADAPVSLKDLQDEPFIMLDIPKTRDYFMSVFNNAGLQPSMIHRAPSADMVRSMVGNGFGYSLLNFGAAERKDIVYKPVPECLTHSNLVAVRQGRRHASPLIDGLVGKAQDFVRQHCVNAPLH
jgi:DNA-binding transcriptional LysR family regulator